MNSGELTTNSLFGETENHPLSARTLVVGLGLFGAYFLGAKIGFALTFQPNLIAVLWPPNGILLAFLLLAPRRHWWFLLLLIVPAHFLSHVPQHFPIWRLCWQLGVNMLLCISAAGCVTRFAGLPMRFNRLREVIAYLSSVGAVTALTSVLSPTCLLSILTAAPGGLTESWIVAWTEWRQVFLANFLGFLLVTPAVLLGAAVRISASSKRRSWWFGEISLLGLGLLAVFLIFSRGHIIPATRPALLYAPLPLMLWAAVRFGPSGASFSLMALALTSIWIAMHGRGPFSPISTLESVLPLQLFIVVISIPLIFLAAAIEERRRAQEQFAKTFRCGPDAMLIKRRRDARIIDVNTEWQKIFGFYRDEAVGRTLSELKIYLTEDDRTKLIGGAAEGEVLRDLEISLRTKAGDVRQSSISADMVEVWGEECLVIVIRDITARKKAEKALRESEELNRAIIEETGRNLAHVSRLALVGELTASIAHEINQPLGAILSNADAAEMLLGFESPPLNEVRQILADIRRDDLRAGEIIRRIRALLRKNEMQTETLEVNEVAFEVIRLVSAEARRRKMPLRTEFIPTPTMIRGDRVHLQQVLLNLILNAMEAMADTPEATRRLIVRTGHLSEQSVEVSVTDSGRGIPAEKLSRLFETFFTTKQDGMGLGLAIARSIIDAHRGRISAENNADEGATFRIHLPAHSNGSNRC